MVVKYGYYRVNHPTAFILFLIPLDNATVQ